MGLLVALSVLACLPADASAQIWRFPATLCRYEDGTQNQDTYFSTTGLAGNGLRNTSASNRDITCPMSTYQNSNQQNWIGQAAFSLSSLAQSDKCNIYWRSTSGKSSGWWAPDDDWDGGGGDAVMYWGTPGYYFDCTNRTCSFNCRIPPNAVIHAYQYSPGTY